MVPEMVALNRLNGCLWLQATTLILNGRISVRVRSGNGTRDEGGIHLMVVFGYKLQP